MAENIKTETIRRIKSDHGGVHVELPNGGKY